MELPLHKRELLENGYTLIAFPDKAPIESMRRTVFTNIADFFGEQDSEGLEFVENRVVASDEYLRLLEHLNTKSIDVRLFTALCDQIRPMIFSLLGENIACETSPRIRFSIPRDVRTTLEIHSDTFYGNSFFEINLWIQLSPSTMEPVLRFVPKSHLPDGGKYDTKRGTQHWDPALVRGRGIGIPYAPVTVDAERLQTVDLSVPYGSALVFFGSVLHSSCVITEPFPRISVDWRLTPLLLPREFRKTKPGSFRSLYTTELYKRILNCYQFSEPDYL